jgi:hypothetical protein
MEGMRVEVVGVHRNSLIRQYGATSFTGVVTASNAIWSAVKLDVPIAGCEVFYVPNGDLRETDDARDDESTADDDASSETKRRFGVGDRVEIVGSSHESLISMAGVDDTRILGEIIEVDDDKATVRPDEEAFQNDVDDDRAWYVRFDDLRPVSPETAETTPAAKPRSRSSSRSKKATPDAQSLDPKRINVVQVDISKAIVGDDFPARPSQAFKDVMCELLIGEYERFGKSETDASA